MGEWISAAVQIPGPVQHQQRAGYLPECALALRKEPCLQITRVNRTTRNFLITYQVSLGTINILFVVFCFVILWWIW